MKQFFHRLRKGYFLSVLWQIIIFEFIITACTTSFSSKTNNQTRVLSLHEKIFISQDFELLYRVKELPLSIEELLEQRSPGIANPGEPFNSTDMVVPDLPFAQLSWAGISKDFGFVLYKQGGFAPHQILLLIELKANHIAATSEFIIPYFIDDIATVKNYVRSGKAKNINEIK